MIATQLNIIIAAVDRFKPIICWLRSRYSSDGLLFDLMAIRRCMTDGNFEKFKRADDIAKRKYDSESQGHINEDVHPLSISNSRQVSYFVFLYYHKVTNIR